MDSRFAVRGRDAGGVAGDLECIGRGNDNDAIDAAAPAGQSALAFAAGAGIAHHFKDQRRLDDGNSPGIARKDLVHPLVLGLDHGRMDDGVQLLQAAFAKGKLGQAGAVELAVGVDHLRAKMLDDCRIDRLAGLHQRAAKLIGFNHVSAEFERNIAATVLLPLPSPPVRPTRSMS